MRERIQLAHLKPTAFQHPLDLAAMKMLQEVPVLNFVLRKLLFEYGFERSLRMECYADNVKVGPLNFPKVHQAVAELARVLDMPAPECFVRQNPLLNAFTTGAQHPMIVIHSGLLDVTDEDELLAVVGHELGHIKCGHVLYLSTAHAIHAFAPNLGLARIAISALEVALWQWELKSELSADRASLLAVQDKAPIIRMFTKLAGGSGRRHGEATTEGFMAQAAEYKQLTKGISLNAVYEGLRQRDTSHPFPVLRAGLIDEWAESSEFLDVISGRTRQPQEGGKDICPHCHAFIPGCGEICRFCGGVVNETPGKTTQEVLGIVGTVGKGVGGGVARLVGRFRGKGAAKQKNLGDGKDPATPAP